MRTPRNAARVAVTDPDGAVFLFRYDDHEEVGRYWAMPGGGLESTETPQEGALRELYEETGWQDLDVGPLLCTWEHDFNRKGVPVRQFEHIFLAHGPRREPTEDVGPAHLEDAILGWRWWTTAELTATTDALWPPQLPALLSRLRGADGHTLPAIDLGYVANRQPLGQ